jgi:predicted Zn-dependent protease
MPHLTLIPAYGRDYKSKADVLKDFIAGKDFESAGIFNTGYIGYPEIEKMAKDRAVDVQIRYQKLSKVMVLYVSDLGIQDHNGKILHENEAFKAKKAVEKTGIPADRLDVVVVGPGKTEDVTARVVGLSREARLQALLRDVVDATAMACDALKTCLEVREDEIERLAPEYRERLENAYKAITAARLEGF